MATKRSGPWIDALAADALAVGCALEVTLQGTPILLVRAAIGHFAVGARCTHIPSQPLVGGWVEDGAWICPRHGARFCLSTGATLCPPACRPIPTYPLRLHKGRIEVRIPARDTPPPS